MSCSDDTANPGGQGGTGAGGSNSGGGGTHQGGSGGAGGQQGGSGGVGGAGGSTPTDQGHPGMDMVNAGIVAKSANYTMSFTLGQSSPNQNTMRSSSYRMQSGLQGANGSLP
ncbi:MAG: hypothetical protein U0271_21090 [Polyangiaceae bacterium]